MHARRYAAWIAATLVTLTVPLSSAVHAANQGDAIARPARSSAANPVLSRQGSRLATFTSARLGISFDYQPGPYYGTSDRVHVKAVGNRVYVYVRAPYQQGQWVEVRTKKPAQSPQDAIRAQLLAHYARTNCVVRVMPSRYSRHTYTVLEIMATHVGPGGDFGTTCPQTYTASNGISYFLADSRHPRALLFFSIGQYPILAGPGQTWQDTIRFL
jgi:hypothetical protein